MPDALQVTRHAPAPDFNYKDDRVRQSGLFQMEEDGTFMLWAWPEILGWQTEIKWLFSPVNEQYPYPGDLWGVDKSGELLIVETKASTSAADPFEDFLKSERKRGEGKFPPTVEEIQTRWKDALDAERQFLAENRDALNTGTQPRSSGPGLVPYSCKRLMTWRWRRLYLDVIAPQIAIPEYEAEVVSALKLLASHPRIAPHYFGLFTIIDSTDHVRQPVSAIGEDLRALATSERVHLRAIECTGYTSSDRALVKIACGRPELRA